MKGQHSSTTNISPKGIETAVNDLDFGIGKIVEFQPVDAERIGLIGNANTSSHIVAYQCRNSNVDCVVSLEGGLLSEFEQRLLRRTPFYEVKAVNKPILAIFAPHPSIDPQHIHHLKYSDRYFVHFPKMSEFHFLNYGAFEQFTPGIIGPPKGDVQQGFELAAIHCLRFFEAFLKDNESSRKFLTEEPAETTRDVIDRKYRHTALPAPPNITIVKDAIVREGMDYLRRIHEQYGSNEVAPYSINFYGELKDWLAWKKDPDFQKRYELYRLALQNRPDSATINYYFAYFALETGRRDLSRTHNLKALELLDTDQSPELTHQRKSQMRAFVEESLADLK